MRRIIYSWLAGAAISACARAQNPALAKFSNALTFYASFDESPTADLANGDPKPKGVEDGADLAPGLYGRALRLHPPDGGKPVSMSYLAPNNIDLSRPGSLAVWIAPKDWVRGDDESDFWIVKLQIGGSMVKLARQGKIGTKRADLVYVAARTEGGKDVVKGAGGSRDWMNGEWHLFVLNWGSDWVSLSLDGGAANPHTLTASFPKNPEGGGEIRVADQDASCQYLMDELMVLNRPLEAEEIKWLYEEGKKAPGSAPREKSP